MSLGNKVLGLAVGQKSFLLAEVVTKGERHAVSHCAEFVFPEGQSLSTPDKLGESLRQFLKSKQILTRDVVIGLPARRLVTRRKDVPPASLAVAASTLRLQAEGEFNAELDNLVMDFAGTPSAAEATTVLIIATNKVLVDECALTAEAAGLRVHAITSTTAALGRATSRLPGGDGLVLSIGPNGAELVIQHGSDPAHLKHLNVTAGAESMTSLAGEIRRMMAAIPRNGTPQTLAVWSSGEENPRSVLEQRLSMPVTTPEISNLVMTETPNTEGYAPAVSLALAAMEPAGLPVDFLHSRLAPPKPPGISNPIKLGIAIGVLALAGLGYAVFNLYSMDAKADQLEKGNNSHAAELTKANMDIAHATFTDNWFPKTKVNLNVMRALSEQFPQVNGRTIWVTSLIAREGGWIMQGKSIEEPYIKSKDPINSPGVVDKMLKDGRFADLVWKDNMEENTKLWAFNVTFTYTGDESNRVDVPTPVADQQQTGGTRGRGNPTGGAQGGTFGGGAAGGRRGGGGAGAGGPGGGGFGAAGGGGGGRGGRGGGGGFGGGGFGGGGQGGGGFGGGGAGGAGGAADPGAVDPTAVN